MTRWVLFLFLLFTAGNIELFAQQLLSQDSPFGMHPAHVAKTGYLQPAYADAQTMGVKWHRPSMYLFWSEVQKNLSDTTLTFGLYDTYYGGIPNGINILANVAPAPKQVTNYTLTNSWMPIDSVKYITFVKAAVERYDGDGVNDMPGLKNPILCWQIGNEPNDRGGKKDFAKLQKMTYATIKEACSECRVLVGGAAQPILPGQGFLTNKDDYFTEFSTSYEPILQELNGGGFDIFDFHWYGNATGDYNLMKPVYEQLRLILGKYNFKNVPVWITEMGAYSGFPAGDTPLFAYQTELQQASDYLKRFVFSLSLGVEKIFPAFGLMEGFKGNDGYFDHTGFIYDGEGSNDLGLGVKKLSYYTYKKMVEVLEESDWKNIVTIQEQNGIHLYKFTKQGTPIWIAWNDSSITRTIAISGITSNQVKATEAVPKYESGKDITDYTTAFRTDTLAVTNGAVTLTLGERPVFVEPLMVTSVENEGENVPQEFRLYQNYPNPFNPTTTIRFSLIPSLSQRERVSEGRLPAGEAGVRVTLKVFDVLGREVATLVDGELSAGEHSIVFDAMNLPSGVYFYRLGAGSFIQIKKMLVTK